MLTAGQVSAIVDQTVEQCTELFKSQGWASITWKADVKKAFSGRRNRSWGGRRNGSPFISLALIRYVGRSSEQSFIEYKSFQQDPEIGNVLDNTVNAIRALVIHEMCHAIQYTGSDKMAASAGIKSLGWTGDAVGHGQLWKTLYRITRNALLNKDVKVVEVSEIKEVEVARTHTMSRPNALYLIRSRKAAGVANKDIIAELVNRHGYKKTTATTYVYSV